MASHRTFVRAYLDAVENGTFVGRVADWYTDDTVQVEFPNKLQPKGATRSFAHIAGAAQAGAKIVKSQSYEIVSFLEQGDNVAVEAIFRARFNVDVLELKAGEVMTARFAMFFTMRDGKIARHHTYDCFEPW